jgi:hypothetical protein
MFIVTYAATYKSIKLVIARPNAICNTIGPGWISSSFNSWGCGLDGSHPHNGLLGMAKERVLYENPAVWCPLMMPPPRWRVTKGRYMSIWYVERWSGGSFEESAVFYTWREAIEDAFKKRAALLRVLPGNIGSRICSNPITYGLQ